MSRSTQLPPWLSVVGNVGSWTYAIVPGYIVNWQYTKNEHGLPVTEVEPITDEAIQVELRHTIESKEAAAMTGFW